MQLLTAFVKATAVEKMDQDFANPLYCWCYTLYTAHREEKTIEEVSSYINIGKKCFSTILPAVIAVWLSSLYTGVFSQYFHHVSTIL